jgi:hypothetical protein
MDSPRVAVLSVHTSPLDQPGTGDSGGMNVYIRAVAERLTEHDIEVDLFTRRRGGDVDDIIDIAPGVRVLNLKAGPFAPVPKTDLPRYLPEFLGGVLRRARQDGRGYDILHSHYWLSGWVGSSAKEIWGVPLVASFHTLGKVKNYSLASGDVEPPARLAGEKQHRGRGFTRPTPAEAAQLVGLYRADPDHIRIVPPGVDHTIFFPRQRADARERLHLSGLRLAVYVGRLQPHKGPDVAVRTLAEAVARDPELTRDLMLAIVGGPSGTGQGAEVTRLMAWPQRSGEPRVMCSTAPQSRQRCLRGGGRCAGPVPIVRPGVEARRTRSAAGRGVVVVGRDRFGRVMTRRCADRVLRSGDRWPPIRSTATGALVHGRHGVELGDHRELAARDPRTPGRLPRIARDQRER